MNVGFIGLGNMGQPMAQNLVKAGHSLTVHDKVAKAAEPLLALGATWASSPRAVAQSSDIVFTSLPGPREVEEVAMGAHGLLEGMGPGKTYVDLSTNSPTTMRSIARRFGERGIHVLDAPVSGGPYGAETRDLSIMAGGDEQAFHRVKLVLDVMGNKVFYCGPAGSGCVCKLVNNLISLSVGVLVAEALTIGVKAGVELGTLFNVVRQSTGNTRRMEGRFSRFLFKGNLSPGFAIDLAVKDLSLELARELHIPAEMLSLGLREYKEAQSRGLGQRDSDAVALLQEERSGVQLRIPEHG
ncbi:MAG: NAD(P)-dependent oxidoreductase [Chloroflexi bacterium]|nr:NAD(P)-dependent oxidoreductase [Chloroflexota bacterium]